MLNKKKFIGWFAYTGNGLVLCDGDSCVIASTKQLIKKYITEISGDEDARDSYIMKKTCFEEIMKGLMLNAAYSFDEESYARYFAETKVEGIGEFPDPESFDEHISSKVRPLVRVQLQSN